MQSYLSAITALLLGCGALGLHVAEPTQQDVKLWKGIFEKLDTKEEFWTSLFTAQFRMSQMHDLNLVANATVPEVPGFKFELPGLVNMSTMVKKALRGSVDDKDKATLTVRAAFLSMLGAADTYSDFNDWWDKSFDASVVPVDAYVKELGHLLKLETPLTGQDDLDLETVYTEESRRGVAKLTDYNSDGFVHRGEAQNFAHSLNVLACKGMAAPKGGTLPERACAVETEGENLRVAPHDVLDKWLSGAKETRTFEYRKR